ncbi:ATP synthase subunit C lysine N-methyltransferase [Dunckerocampus dactyliophorus]|uniref:ATP synthase subunit C lysine N-methyltransferase n=1 Tax=Dunckerocampus dactyliophorus TaxID=161453 RepID=UPI0024071491|nr:ATP synthase subunit C lysine N-methyltransferase [Dunckerocampus dactyliophorus]
MSEDDPFMESTGQCITKESKSRSRMGLFVTGVVGSSLVALYAVAAPFVAPALRKICLPFVPATTVQVENVLNALRVRSGTLVDIGSGDGRIVIEAARRGFQASGFELNPWLVCYSRYKAWREGVYHSTSFHISDLWKVSFSQYSNVVIFGVPQMMDQLELKLEKELPSCAKVVACRFPFPNWVPEHTVGEGVDTVWVYDAQSFKSHMHLGMARKTRPEKRDIAESHNPC